MINSVVLVGRITKDLELKQAGMSETVRFTLAVNRRFKGKDGSRNADFISCVAWGQTARFIATYGRKGQLVAVEGSIETGSYTRNNQTVYTTDVRCENIQLLENKSNQTGLNTPNFNQGQSNKDTFSLDHTNNDFGNSFQSEDHQDELSSLQINTDDFPF